MIELSMDSDTFFYENRLNNWCSRVLDIYKFKCKSISYNFIHNFMIFAEFEQKDFYFSQIFYYTKSEILLYRINPFNKNLFLDYLQTLK